ncbi:MAG: T9SS type A sorting domain-containing protein [Chitinophagales bacterium]
MKQKQLFKTISMLAILLWASNADAQHCAGVSGSSVCTSQTGLTLPGFYPDYQTLPCAVDGVPYDEVISFKAPTTALYQGFNATIDWIRIDSIENLPCGLCWRTNLVRDSMLGGATACIRVTGTTFDAPGQFKMRIIISVKAHVGFISQTQVLQNAEQFGIKYWAKVKAAPNATCITVDTLAVGNTRTTPGAITAVNITGTTTLCSGGSTTLTAAGATYDAYVWSNGSLTSGITTSTPGTYTVTVFDNCNSATSSVNVTTPNVTPTLIASGPTTFCSGGSVTLDAGGGFDSYSWSNGASTQTVNITQAASYTCTVTKNGCTGTSNTITITVNNNPSPNVLASGPVTFCTGGSVTLDAGGGYSSYIWSNGATTQSIVASQTAVYSCTVTQSGCSGISNTVSVTVNSNPAPSITPSGSTAICAGSSVTLDVGNGYSSYSWSNGSTSPTIVANQSGSYICSVTLNGCTGVASPVTVTVTDPTPSISANGPTTFCTGGNVTLDAGSGFASYVWSNGDQTQLTLINQAGSYAVTVTKNGCTGVSNTVTITITTNNLNPQISATPSLNICPGGSTSLDAGAGYDTYLWSNTSTTQTISANSTATYTVTVTQGACSGTASASVSVGNYPVTVVINPAGVINACEGDVVMLTTSAGFDSYSWSSGQQSDTIEVTSSAMYHLTVTENSCIGEDSVEVVFNSLPHPAISPAGPVNACSGDIVGLDAGSGFTDYNWSSGATTQLSQVVSSGSYIVTVTQNGCSGNDTVEVNYFVNPVTNISPAGPLSVCESVTLSADPGFSQYSWSNDSIGSSILVTSSGTYVVTVTDNNCSGTASVSVTVSSLPHATITPSGVINICEGDSVSLDAGSGYSLYQWSNSANTQTNVVSTTGVYNVTVSDGNCSGDATNQVTVFVNVVPEASFTNTVITLGNSIFDASPDNAAVYIWQNSWDTTTIEASYTATDDSIDVFCNIGVLPQGPGSPRGGNFSLIGNYVRLIVESAAGCRDTTAWVLNDNCQYGGINDLQDIVNISLLPNPVNDVLQVNYSLQINSIVTISVMDMSGRRVLNSLVENQYRGTQQKGVNVSELANGIYIVHISTNQGMYNSRFVKQ